MVVVGNDGHLVVKSCGGNDSVSEGKFALLAQVDGDLGYFVREGQNGYHCEERFQSFLFGVCEAMVAKHFNVADGGRAAGIGFYDLPQPFVLWLDAIDDDVAVEEHQLSGVAEFKYELTLEWAPHRT